MVRSLQIPALLTAIAVGLGGLLQDAWRGFVRDLKNGVVGLLLFAENCCTTAVPTVAQECDEDLVKGFSTCLHVVKACHINIDSPQSTGGRCFANIILLPAYDMSSWEHNKDEFSWSYNKGTGKTTLNIRLERIISGTDNPILSMLCDDPGPLVFLIPKKDGTIVKIGSKECGAVCDDSTEATQNATDDFVNFVFTYDGCPCDYRGIIPA